MIDADASRVTLAASAPTVALSLAIQYELAGFHYTAMPRSALRKKTKDKDINSEILLSVVRVIQLLFRGYPNWGKPGLKFGRSLV